MKNSNDIEQAPVLRLFGHHASLMAALLRIRPDLMTRVTYAPRRSIHAIGAFLHLSPDADQPDIILAKLLSETDPRVLLRSAIPNAPRQLYRALDRAGDQVREKSWYERLAVLSCGPLCDLLLAGENLDDAQLDRIEALLAMDPIMLSMRGILGRSPYQLEQIDAVMAFLRAHDALREADFRLPDEAGLTAVNRRLQAALDRIEAPTPKFSLPPPFRILKTVGELRAVGSNLKNCVRSFRYCGTEHWFRLSRGLTVYVTADAPPMLAALRWIGPKLYHLQELCGPENKNVEPETKELLITSLKSAGLRILRYDPADAFSMLSNVGDLDETEDENDDIEDALAA